MKHYHNKASLIPNSICQPGFMGLDLVGTPLTVVEYQDRFMLLCTFS